MKRPASMLCVLPLVLASCGSAPHDSDDSRRWRWTKWAPAREEAAAPGPRAGATMFHWNGRILLYGGYTTVPVSGGYESSRYRDLWSFNPATREWSPVVTRGSPPELLDPAAVWAGDSLFLIGGRSPDTAKRNLPQPLYLWRWEPRTGEWKDLSGGVQAPAGRARAGVVWTGKEILVLGGVSADRDLNLLNELWSFDPSATRWTRLSSGSEFPPFQHWPYHLVGTLWLDGKMVVFAATVKSGVERVWTYHPDREKWSESSGGGPRPGYRFAPVILAADGNRAFMIGGYKGGEMGGSGADYLDDVWLYDAGPHPWSHVVPEGTPGSRSQAAGVRLGKGILLFGGVRQDLAFQNDLWCLEVVQPGSPTPGLQD